MRTRTFGLAATMLVFALAGAGCMQQPPPPVPTETTTPTPESPSGTASAPALTITISVPAANAPVGNPIIASGKGIAFENTIQLRVRDANDQVLGESFATAYAPEYDAPGPWRVAVAYRAPTTATGFFEAYESSAKDGSELHLVRVPVTFAKDTIPLQVALVDVVEGDPGKGPECPMRIAQETYRIPRTKAVARAAVEALLAAPPPIPPTNPELFSALALTYADLRGITIANGTATVDLSLGVLEKTSGFDGECRARQAAAQLRATLTQFPTIRTVRVLVDGKPHPLFP